jgi:hypothetical protein
LVGKSEGKKSLGIDRRKWENNITIGYNGIVSDAVEMDCSGSA